MGRAGADRLRPRRGRRPRRRQARRAAAGEGMECFRVLFAAGHGRQRADHERRGPGGALAELLRAAVWLGSGARRCARRPVGARTGSRRAGAGARASATPAETESSRGRGDRRGELASVDGPVDAQEPSSQPPSRPAGVVLASPVPAGPRPLRACGWLARSCGSGLMIVVGGCAGSRR